MNSQEIYEKIKLDLYENYSKEQLDEFMQLSLNHVHNNNKDDVAIFIIGKLYNDVYKDYEKAEEWYIKSADLGNYCAMNGLGTIYYDKKQYKKAEEWYIKSADLGNTLANYNLGVLYCYVYKDYKKAEEYFLKSLDISTSLYGLYLLYKYKNNEKANEWLIKSAELGFSKAIDDILDNNLLEFINKTIIEHMKEKQLEKYNKLKQKHKKLDKVYNSIEEQCNICYEPLLGTTNSLFTNVCGHTFHYSCIKKCNECPNCRYDVKL